MMDENRIRTRSESELKSHAQGLKELANILDEFDIYWFLSCGALLGAYRDGDFIPWDWDIDIELKKEQASPVIKTLVRRLNERGFKARASRFRVIAKKYGTMYILRLWGRKGKWRRLGKARKVPAKYFESLGQIELRGNMYPCPADIEGFLEFRYGDWRTPVKAANPANYVTREFYRKGEK